MAPSLLFSFLLVAIASSPTASTNTEGEALHTFRARLNDPTNVLQSWDPTLVNPCTWFHVTCNNKNQVIRLDLGNSNISGPIGPELGRLDHLQYLELYRNNFDGKIPKELGNLKSLISLDLYENKLEGHIPKSLGKLKSLVFIRLNNNRLTGPIPKELASLTNLKVLCGFCCSFCPSAFYGSVCFFVTGMLAYVAVMFLTMISVELSPLMGLFPSSLPKVSRTTPDLADRSSKDSYLMMLDVRFIKNET